MLACKVEYEVRVVVLWGRCYGQTTTCIKVMTAWYIEGQQEYQDYHPEYRYMFLQDILERILKRRKWCRCLQHDLLAKKLILWQGIFRAFLKRWSLVAEVAAASFLLLTLSCSVLLSQTMAGKAGKHGI